ncbi:hypothetical protein CLV63_101152 [Murinocardiopsis flavida]|uniref:DUF6782 domain-containing protein n=1 Tax=Murinocardiopsis flavida TaxID=645275 RepID=A0A2P8DTX6_9ACTN|nr:DUF6782 family putative metallopeptidase [Murinocardiopsis flavida]PSL00678.1 hypothetical protein CLV63_101152 [Murinocardiopsis flavida]
MPRPPRQDGGAGLIEYGAVIVLVAALFAVAATSSVGQSVTANVSAALTCLVQSSSDCEGEEPGPGAPAEPDTSDDPDTTDDPGEPAPQDPIMSAPEDEPIAESYECGSFQGLCDFGQGAGAEARDLVSDAWDGVQGTGCLVHICSNEEFRGTWAGVGDSARQVVTDPLGAIEQSWNEFTDGPQEDYANGNETRSAGRSVVLGIGSIFGLGPLRLLPEKREVPDRPGHEYLAESQSAARRGDVSSAQRNADLAEEVAQASEEAAAENPKDMGLADQAERDRRDADQAALEVRGAEAVSLMLETEIGRELNGVLNESGTTITFSNDPDLARTAYFQPGDNSIVIGRDLLDDPLGGIHLVHEAAHARRQAENANFPLVGYPRDAYLKNTLENEADAQISEFVARQELRENGTDVPLDGREQYYNERYLHWKEAWEDAPGVSPEAAEALAQTSAREDLAVAIGSMTSSKPGNPTYEEQYGGDWDAANPDGE